MKNEIDVIRDLAKKFAEGGIDYMLTGSLAMNYYAQPRMTRDIDVVVRLEPQDADVIVRLFGSDYYVAREAVNGAIARASVFNLIHQESIIKVDCIVRKDSDYRRLEFTRRSAVTIQNFTTWIVSKEDLIISKLHWSRDSRSELQLRDVRSLWRQVMTRATWKSGRRRWACMSYCGSASMDDTSPEVKALVREMLMSRSGEERFVMGALMFDAARDLVIASIPPGLPAHEFKRRLFERIYGFSLEHVQDVCDDEQPPAR
ncbi:MAG: hypothetical protein ACR2LZ_05775 [Pyrinomonadaceae bacterium]